MYRRCQRCHYMSVNSNSTTSQQNMKKLLISKTSSFIAGVVDTGDKHLLSKSLQIFVKMRNGTMVYSGARGKLIQEKNLKSISCQTPFNETQIISG